MSVVSQVRCALTEPGLCQARKNWQHGRRELKHLKPSCSREALLDLARTLPGFENLCKHLTRKMPRKSRWGRRWLKGLLENIGIFSTWVQLRMFQWKRHNLRCIVYLLLKNIWGFRPQGRCQAPLPVLQQRHKEQVQWHGALSLKIMCLWIIFEASLQASGEWMTSLRGLTVLSHSSEESSSPFALPWCNQGEQGGLKVPGMDLRQPITGSPCSFCRLQSLTTVSEVSIAALCTCNTKPVFFHYFSGQHVPPGKICQ